MMIFGRVRGIVFSWCEVCRFVGLAELRDVVSKRRFLVQRDANFVLKISEHPESCGSPLRSDLSHRLVANKLIEQLLPAKAGFLLESHPASKRRRRDGVSVDRSMY